MKILITVKTYWPEVNGVQNVTQYQAEGLSKMGHDVVVFTSDYQGKYKSEDIHNGVRIIRLPIFDRNTIHHGDKKSFQKKVLSYAEDCDAVFNVCLQGWAADWVLPILRKIRCRKILMNHSMHNFKWEKDDFRSFKDFLKKCVKNIKYGLFYPLNWKRIILYDGIAFSHEKDYALEYFKKHGYTKNYVLHNAVDDVFFDTSFIIKKNLILNVGTFNDRKNQIKTIELFYKANTKDYKLVLIGMPRNDYYKRLLDTNKKMSEKYGPKEVEIYCSLESSKTIDFFLTSSIYMTNSTWECLPISLIDSMAGGAAFLSTDVGVIKYLPGGIIAKSDDEMIRGLEELIDGKSIELGRCAKEYCVNNFKKEGQIKKLERILLGQEPYDA